MVCRLTSRPRLGVINIALDTVITCSTDSNGTTLHQEILAAVNAITYCRGDIDHRVLDSEILTCLDSMFHITHNVERSLLGKLGMSLDIETSLLLTACRINQGIGSTVDHLHFDALTVLDMDGGTAIYWCRVG